MSDGLDIVAGLMALSARTAPKAAGKDFIEVKVLRGKDKDAVGNDMLRIAKERKNAGFARDGKSVSDSRSLVLIGLRKHEALGLDCAACGHKCKGMKQGSVKADFSGPSCAIRVLDMGIAIGSAVKTASIHNADNRVMYRAGVSAKRLGLIEADFVMGIPLSGTGKSIYYDR
ncbi:MAG: hypothetical protein HZB92_02895 [Euryarchaeota archaeon]|nr:hypothetical protein [Euryarchaeota archaeon]